MNFKILFDKFGQFLSYLDIVLFLILLIYEKFKCAKGEIPVLVALCGVLCAVSFWVGHVAALVCLFGASVGMAEALVLSFILRSSFDAKLLYLMLFFLALGLLMFAFGMEKAGGYLCFGVLLSGVALVFRFVLYMNKYCRRDADERLNETT